MGFSRLIKSVLAVGAMVGLALPAGAQTFPNSATYNQTTVSTTIQNDLISTGNLYGETGVGTQAATSGNFMLLQPAATLGQNTVLTIPDGGSATDTLVTTKAANVFTGTPVFPAITLTGTSHNATVQAVAALGQATTLTIPDGGSATDTFATLKAANAFTGASTFSLANGLGLVGTSHTATIKVQSTLGQTTTVTLPDGGSATDTIATVKATNNFTGANIFSLANGIQLAGTSHNDTLIALAAQGQGTTLTLEDVGGATGYIYTMTAAQTAAGVLSRADMVTEVGDTLLSGILNIKNIDGTTLANAAGAGVFGISTTATFGSPAQLSLVTEVANNNTKTDSCEFEFTLPPDYVAGSAINVNVGQNITIGGGTLSTKTLTVDAFKVAADGTVGSNLGPAAQTLTNSQGTLVFAITPTGLVAGNKLLIQLQTVLTETAMSNVHANLTSVTVTSNVKM